VTGAVLVIARIVADYFAPGPDDQKRRHTKTFASKKEATAWLAYTVVEIKQGVHTPATGRRRSKSSPVDGRGGFAAESARRQ